MNPAVQQLIERYYRLIVPLAVWSITWKSLALWRAARRGEKGWFIAFMVVNTVGVIEILYLCVFAKKNGVCGGAGTAILTAPARKPGTTA